MTYSVTFLFFFRELFTELSWRAEYKSTILSKLEYLQHIKHYKETNVNWNSMRRYHSDDDSGEVEVFIPPLENNVDYVKSKSI